MENVNVIEEVPVVQGEIYQPGKLKDICLKKVYQT